MQHQQTAAVIVNGKVETQVEDTYDQGHVHALAYYASIKRSRLQRLMRIWDSQTETKVSVKIKAR
jgi:peptidyl-tRNA hydrolase